MVRAGILLAQCNLNSIDTVISGEHVRAGILLAQCNKFTENTTLYHYKKKNKNETGCHIVVR